MRSRTVNSLASCTAATITMSTTAITPTDTLLVDLHVKYIQQLDTVNLSSHSTRTPLSKS